MPPKASGHILSSLSPFIRDNWWIVGPVLGMIVGVIVGYWVKPIRTNVDRVTNAMTRLAMKARGSNWVQWHRGITVLSIIVSVGSLLFGYLYEFTEPFSTCDVGKKVEAGLLAFWILAPPVWFWFEYYFLFKWKLADVSPDGKKDEFERLKHGQDQAAKIWLALVTVLLGVYFGKDLTRDAATQTAKPCALQTSGITKELLQIYGCSYAHT